jgi:hypothetical protein
VTLRPRPAVERRHAELGQAEELLRERADELAEEAGPRLRIAAPSRTPRLAQVPEADLSRLELAMAAYRRAYRIYASARRRHVADRCCVV